MHNIKLPKYITYTDGTRYLSSQYERTKLRSSSLTLDFSGALILIFQQLDGSLSMFGHLEHVSTYRDFDANVDFPDISQETIDELNLINAPLRNI